MSASDARPPAGTNLDHDQAERALSSAKLSARQAVYKLRELADEGWIPLAIRGRLLKTADGLADGVSAIERCQERLAVVRQGVDTPETEPLP